MSKIKTKNVGALYHENTTARHRKPVTVFPTKRLSAEFGKWSNSTLTCNTDIYLPYHCKQLSESDQ